MLAGGKCPRGYCCMNLASSSTGSCVRKQNFHLRLGDLCQRTGGCDYCQCQPGLICAKNGYHFFPEVYTCQEINPVSLIGLFLVDASIMLYCLCSVHSVQCAQCAVCTVCSVHSVQCAQCAACNPIFKL